MSEPKKTSFSHKLRTFFIGKPKAIKDQSLLHSLSLIAFFAWVGLGADGLSSSCYGPPEAFIALGHHFYLGIFVAIASALTVFVISASYSQIIDLFPQGGGGYLVASQLLSPTLGMIAGCALLIDYILTITVSIASGADALFSLLPPDYLIFKVAFAVLITGILIVMNLRGVKESVTPLVPIFLIFVITHVFVILYAIVAHLMVFPQVVSATRADIGLASSQIGLMGMLLLVLRAYSMGAGTYTGIEAVSNGLPILREPRAQTGKRTMSYMAFSLAFMVGGLMLAYILYRIVPVEGKTINAALLDNLCAGWGPNWRIIFIGITLVSEAVILFVAAQTGFLGGPRVLANMATDGWAPKRFGLLSDRLVTENGVLIMGLSALAMLLLTQGSVQFLVVLYSINVFITFLLSQLGMVKHWWRSRFDAPAFGPWLKSISINGIGLIMTAFILISVSVLKFNDGGWITMVVTGSLVFLSLAIKGHYREVDQMIHQLDERVMGPEKPRPDFIPALANHDPNKYTTEKTAVIFVKDFNGIGVQTISNVLHSFKGVFKNVVLVQFGLINAGNFAMMEGVEKKVKGELDSYISLMKQHGYYSEGFCVTGTDTIDEITKTMPQIIARFPDSVFFGGQVVFPKETIFNKFLHNYTLFTIQKKLFDRGISFFIVPIRL